MGFSLFPTVTQEKWKQMNDMNVIELVICSAGLIIHSKPMFNVNNGKQLIHVSYIIQAGNEGNISHKLQ